MQAGQRDDKYMEIMQRLEQSTRTCTILGAGIGVGTGTGDQGANYRLTANGLVRFRDKICVLNCIELKKLILREFNVKSYWGHIGY